MEEPIPINNSDRIDLSGVDVILVHGTDFESCERSGNTQF